MKDLGTLHYWVSVSPLRVVWGVRTVRQRIPSNTTTAVSEKLFSRTHYSPTLVEWGAGPLNCGRFSCEGSSLSLPEDGTRVCSRHSGFVVLQNFLTQR